MHCLKISRSGYLDRSWARLSSAAIDQSHPGADFDQRLWPSRALSRFQGAEHRCLRHGRADESMRPSGPRAADGPVRYRVPFGFGARRLRHLGRAVQPARHRPRRTRRSIAARCAGRRSVSARHYALQRDRRSAASAPGTASRPRWRKPINAATAMRASSSIRRIIGDVLSSGSAGRRSCSIRNWKTCRTVSALRQMIDRLVEARTLNYRSAKILRGIPVAALGRRADQSTERFSRRRTDAPPRICDRGRTPAVGTA